MKFGLICELILPRPADAAQWDALAEQRLMNEVLEQIELADRLGFDYFFMTEHHFLEEFSHSSAPEVYLGAASQRTKNIRLGHGAMNTVPRINHPARVAERISTLDLLCNGRLEFGAAEGATDMELAGFGVPREKKAAMWEEGTREACNMMVQVPYPGYRGQAFSMPERNVLPKPLQKPHPPLWMAAGSAGATFAAARRGMGALAFGVRSPEELSARRDEYYRQIREECTPIGHAINPAIATCFPLSCSRTEGESNAQALEGAELFAYGIMHYGGSNELKHQPGRSNIYRDFTQLPSDLRQRMSATARESGCIGTPEHIRNTLLRYEEQHLDLMLFIVQVGARPHEDILETLELFGTEVMPEFKDRHPKHVAWREAQLQGVKHLVNSSI